MEYLQNQEHPSLDVFRRRSAVTGFRTGMVAYALEGFKWTQAVSDWALWMAEYTLQNQIELFGDEMDKIMLSQTSTTVKKKARSGANFLLFDELNDTFSINDIIDKRMEKGLAGDARYIPSRWMKYGMIQKAGQNQWTKTEEFRKQNATDCPE